MCQPGSNKNALKHLPELNFRQCVCFLVLVKYYILRSKETKVKRWSKRILNWTKLSCICFKFARDTTVILEITGKKVDVISSFRATCSHYILWLKGYLILMFKIIKYMKVNKQRRFLLENNIQKNYKESVIYNTDKERDISTPRVRISNKSLLYYGQVCQIRICISV